jgi:hypothetical protein
MDSYPQKRSSKSGLQLLMNFSPKMVAIQFLKMEEPQMLVLMRTKMIVRQLLETQKKLERKRMMKEELGFTVWQD